MILNYMITNRLFTYEYQTITIQHLKTYPHLDVLNPSQNYLDMNKLACIFYSKESNILAQTMNFQKGKKM